MIHRGEFPQYGGGGEAWCSPTSTAMVLGYYGRLPAPSSYAWVGPRTDPWVDEVARRTYNVAYDGTGNWPFNTAYAASRGLTAFVTRLRSLAEAERGPTDHYHEAVEAAGREDVRPADDAQEGDD